jgi:23S rRNA (uracil1939-C5)-methyltransferase
VSDEIEGTVRELSRFGEGVVSTAAGDVLVDGALPGERLALAGVRRHGRSARAERFRVLDGSSQRVEATCPVVDRCGGCPLMVASAAFQANFKRALLEQALEGLPGADPERYTWLGTHHSLCYRRRARLRWDASGGRPRLGYLAPRSEQVVDVRSCAVLDPAIDTALGVLRRHAGEHLRGVGELHLAMGGAQGTSPVAALRSDAVQPPELYAALEALVARGELAGAAMKAGGATKDATWGDAREVRRGADGTPLVGTVAGFSQVHDEINAALVRRVVELARPAGRDVLELFSGSGNLTVVLSATAKSVLAVEQSPEAADACRENLRARGLTATVRTDDAETYRIPARPDVAVLDPPRAGAPGAVSRLAKVGAPVIVYVSCEPTTLARDLRFLAGAGYVVTDATAFDMFPQTAHVESVVRLERPV